MSWQVIEADCLEAMAEMDDASVDAVVTDPPAGISFMGRGWDSDRSGGFVAWLASVMEEALRVTKPGGHALVWALPRTSHWTGSAIEAAGWEIRDRIAHHFGSGFPKSLNVGNGMGTALKPATEDWWLARKPLIGTVAQNVERFGTGALNIDGCRIGIDPDDKWSQWAPGSPPDRGDVEAQAHSSGRWPANVALSHLPECERVGERRVKAGTAVRRNKGIVASSNVQFNADDPTNTDDISYADSDGLETVEAWRCATDENGNNLCPVAELDRQSGERPGMASQVDTKFTPSNYFGLDKEPGIRFGRGDTGGASRFFYIAKASRAERNAGLEGFEDNNRDGQSVWAGECNVCGCRMMLHGKPTCGHDDFRWVTGKPTKNAHPTVKPVDLMRWLVRLVTPPGGTVLDPFAGSGTTGIACVLDEDHFIGIEREAEYVEIAKARIAWWDTHKDRADEILALSAKSERERTAHVDAGQLGLLE